MSNPERKWQRFEWRRMCYRMESWVKVMSTRIFTMQKYIQMQQMSPLCHFTSQKKLSQEGYTQRRRNKIRDEAIRQKTATACLSNTENYKNSQEARHLNPLRMSWQEKNTSFNLIKHNRSGRLSKQLSKTCLSQFSLKCMTTVMTSKEYVILILL